MMKTVAIIVAAGSGKRMGLPISKQYLCIRGVPVLAHTLNVFHKSPDIDDIFLVVPSHDIGFVRDSIVQKYGLSKVTRILAGGKERQDSVKNALDVVDSEYDIVVIHDGVRPFVTQQLIHAVVTEMCVHSAVTVGMPVKETVKVVDGQGWVKSTLNRDEIWITQTPQAFKRDIVKAAYAKAYENRFYATDDAALVERIGVAVKMVEGSGYNIKITTKEDLAVAEKLIQECAQNSV